MWLDALWQRDARFGASLASVAGRVRLPDGWVACLNSPTEHLIYLVAEGAFDAQIGDEPARRIGAGDLLWSARGQALRFSKRAGDRLMVWRFRLEARAPNGAHLPFSASHLHLQNARECQIWIERIVDEVSQPAPICEVRMRGLLACFLTEIVRHSDAPAMAAQLSRAQRQTIHRLVDEAQTPLSPADLARAVELSPDYFARCFRGSYGVSPRRFLVEERLRMAALQLLESPHNVSQIALALGYRDVFLFSRQFKAHFGQSPTAYRASHREIHVL